ncbi:hypothetical protein ACFQ21_03700 [Ohtaekwangia kribbensis]|uniref:Lipid/polyisoprenoid-binding YceI-like domain-containing protein n=1 Tax=Ohtaekwangia kribbensis TaxID=688913 RepID=A0ABW3JX18_9BACT
MRLYIKIFLSLMLISKSAHSQLSVQFLNESGKEVSPELYFKFKLQDTIFSKHEGIKLKNFASVKFDIDRNGLVDNIFFSALTDSLLKPYIIDVLMTTNNRWVINQNGKKFKKKVTLILPMIFTLRPRIEQKISTRIDVLSEKPFEDIEVEATGLFQFEKNDRILYFAHKNPLKYFGIVLNPIEVRVPYDPDANDY